jgi:hypothetical protein
VIILSNNGASRFAESMRNQPVPLTPRSHEVNQINISNVGLWVNPAPATVKTWPPSPLEAAVLVWEQVSENTCGRADKDDVGMASPFALVDFGSAGSVPPQVPRFKDFPFVCRRRRILHSQTGVGLRSEVGQASFGGNHWQGFWNIVVQRALAIESSRHQGRQYGNGNRIV